MLSGVLLFLVIVEYDKYTRYLNEWQQAIEDGSLGFPVHIIYYEQMKKVILV